MKRWYRNAASMVMAAFLTISLFSSAAMLRAEEDAKNVDDLYIEVYNTILGADEAWQMGKKRDAYELYQRAQEFLGNIKKTYPDWNQKLVDFRLSYVKAKMELFTPSNSEPALKEEDKARPFAPDTLSDSEKEIRSLRSQLDQLEKARAELEVRLKEATSAQPATTDPKQLERAERTISELTHTNALLQLQVENLNKSLSEATPSTDKEELSARDLKRLDKARLEAKKLEEELDSVKKENNSLKKEVKRLNSGSYQVVDHTQSDALQKELTAAQDQNKLLQEQLKELQAALQSGKGQDLQKNLADQQALIADMTTRLEKLRSENEALKGAAGTASTEAQKEADESRARYDSAAAELSALKATSAQMQKDLDSARSSLAAASTVDESQFKSLQEQVADLERNLEGIKEENKVLRDAASRKGAEKVVRDMDRLRSKIAVYERNKEPYSAEELALMRPGKPIRTAALLDSQVTLSTTESAQGSALGGSLRHNAPEGGHQIAAEGVREFSAGRMNEAERIFQRLLSLDTNNVYSLGNLGAAQLELGKTQEAEINLKKAYSLDPEDTYVINLLAVLNLKNRKIDDAFELLSTSAKLDPKNAETQNYLGMVLGERGLRSDAEKAFRSAVSVNPQYPVAHYNLAVLYATTKPAYPQLASFHYRKALALGIAKNPEFEKMLAAALAETQAEEKANQEPQKENEVTPEKTEAK